MTDFVPAFILTKSGRIRDGLSALLGAIPDIGLIGQIEHGKAVLQLVPSHYRALVVLDANIPGSEVWVALKEIKAKDSQTRCIVLVANTLQQQMAQAAGADSVLFTGFTAVDFFSAIEELLFQSRDDNNDKDKMGN